jgi:hypothetical protein
MKKLLNGSWGFIAPTPIGPGWGWGSRAIEVISTPLGLIFWTGVWIGRAVSWPFRRLFQ